MGTAAKPSAAGLGWSALTCVVAAFVATSLGEAVGTVPMPAFLASSMAMVPGPFRIHILSCCAGLGAGSAAFAAALSGRPHRGLGRAALALLLAGALTSVPVAWAGSSAPLAKAAFLGQAATLAAAVAVGWRAARRGRVRLHRGCMAVAALALSGAPLSRLVLKVPDPWLSPDLAYAAVAWFAWLAPFAVAAGVALARRREAAAPETASPGDAWP